MQPLPLRLLSEASEKRLHSALDDYYGLPRKRVLSQRDVPGMTRGVVPSLAAVGAIGVSVGVNTNSAPPAVPGVQPVTEGAAAGIFRWRDEATNTEVLTSIHGGGYGGHGGQNIYALTEAGNCIVVPVRHVLELIALAVSLTRKASTLQGVRRGAVPILDG